MPAAVRRDARMPRAEDIRALARQAPRLAGAPSTALPAGDLEKKGPKQRLPRSGQLARRGHWRASGRGSQRRGKGGEPAAGSHRTSQPAARLVYGRLGDDLQKHTLPRRSGCCWRQLQTPAATGPLPMPSPCHRKRNEARSFGSLLGFIHSRKDLLAGRIPRLTSRAKLKDKERIASKSLPKLSWAHIPAFQITFNLGSKGLDVRHRRLQ